MDDSWLFADTIGFYKAFAANASRATMFNAFPVTEFFATNPLHQEIKFRFKSDKDDSPITIFRRGDKVFWTQITSQDRPASKVFEHIRSIASRVNTGDAVNLCLVCHLHPNGDFVLSTEHVEFQRLLQALTVFPEDLNLNLLVKSCYAGHAVDAIKSESKQFQNRYIQAS